jgi:segregation and condensation protein B
MSDDDKVIDFSRAMKAADSPPDAQAQSAGAADAAASADDADEPGGERITAATPAEAKRILEAMLFASDDVMSPAKIKASMPGQPDLREIKKMVSEINTQLSRERHPFEIIEVAGGFQFRTIAYYSPWVRQLLKEKAARRLSQQALESLAIIAYKQPITKAEIESIRGVVTDGAIKTLLERRLVYMSGRSDKPGKPLLYSTTREFLVYFGLKSLEDIPKIEEFEALVKEKMGDLESELARYGEERTASDGTTVGTAEQPEGAQPLTTMLPGGQSADDAPAAGPAA